MSSAPDPVRDVQEVRVRRAPKLPVFLILGLVLGAVIMALVVLILDATGAFPIDPAVGAGPTVGYFALWGAVGGLLLGALIGILADVVSQRRARVVAVERAVVAADAEPSVELEAKPVRTSSNRAKNASGDDTSIE